LKALNKHIEAIIFSSDKPVRLKDIVEALNKADGRSKIDKKKVEAAIDKIEEKYNDPEYAFSMLRISDGFQFLTKTEYHKTVSSYLNVKSKRRLSSAAMETLAVIAYKQPVTKSEIEQIRGVNCDYTVQRLLEKELVEIAGRSPGPGRPLFYATSKMFMDHFALSSIKDLPQLKEIVPEDNVIGIPELEDEPSPEELAAAIRQPSGEVSPDELAEVDELAAEVNAYQEPIQESELAFPENNEAPRETEVAEVAEQTADSNAEIVSEEVD